MTGKQSESQRGFTMILAMLLILIFMGLALNLTYDTKAKALLQGGMKLQQTYQVAAMSVLEQCRGGLADDWVDPDPLFAEGSMGTWRFGTLLASGAETSPDGYGILQCEGSYIANAGMMELTYRVWVANNSDDPALIMYDPDSGDPAFANPNWDLDGKLVLTAEVFGPGSDSVPMAVQTILAGMTGAEFISRYGDISTEGDYGKTLNQGTGDLGNRDSLSLDSLK